MIFGIGTDICDVRRIEATLQRQGERFARKVLTDAEVLVWKQRTARSPERGLRYLATRFSAKEAFSKAVGLGMRLPMTWRRCEIANEATGQPLLVLHGDLKTWFEAQGLSAHVSLTDESDYAASFVVVERHGMTDRTRLVPPVAEASATPAAAPSKNHPTASAPIPDAPTGAAPGGGVEAEATGSASPQAAPQAAGSDRSILGRLGGLL
jgi:holo-[acyl-carrier-protein] synthase